MKRENEFAVGVVVIAASASLFGEWAASLVSLDQLPSDPNIKQAITEAQAAGGGKWPGATLPDIGQLTAQASRIATDIATVSSRIQTARMNAGGTRVELGRERVVLDRYRAALGAEGPALGDAVLRVCRGSR